MDTIKIYIREFISKLLTVKVQSNYKTTLSNPPPFTNCLKTGHYYIQQETGKVGKMKTPFQSQKIH